MHPQLNTRAPHTLGSASGWLPRAPFEGPSGYVVPRKIRGVAITEDDISETVRAFAQAAAEDGLVKLRDELPEVIISDLQMPRMAGIEFMSVVRRRFPSIPVICLSGLIPEEVGGASWAAVEFSRKGLEPPQD